MGSSAMWVVRALGLAFTVLVIATPVGLAQEAQLGPDVTVTRLSVDFEPSRIDGLPNYLTAHLTTADGSAVVRQEVRFRRAVAVFGGRTDEMGRAVTDKAGVARLAIVPREARYEVTASFGGTDELAASEVTVEIEFPAETVIRPDRALPAGLVDPRLQPLAGTMPVILSALVATVWVVLLWVVTSTVVRIRSAGRSEAGQRVEVREPPLGSVSERSADTPTG